MSASALPAPTREAIQYLGDRAEIQTISFSQDYQSFAFGTQSGFQVFNTDPVRLRFRRDPFDPDNPGGIALIELLFQSSILALVGGGRHPRFPPDQVIIWDESRGSALAEVDIKAPVLAIRLVQGRLFVASELRIDVFSLTSAENMHICQLTTGLNPLGLMAVLSSPLRFVHPTPLASSLRLVTGIDHPTWPSPPHNERRLEGVCKSQLSLIALDPLGRLLATASELGTIIRIWDFESLTVLHEFRRGTTEAGINGIVFSPDSRFLMVTSHTSSTIHIFSLNDVVKNTFTRLAGVVSWFGYAVEWACFTFNATSSAVRYCCFSDYSVENPNHFSVIVIAADGTYFKQPFEIVGDKLQNLESSECLFLDERPLSTSLSTF